MYVCDKAAFVRRIRQFRFGRTQFW